MLIRAWDRGEEREWRDWLAGRDFGLLAANNPDGGPVLVPTHFLLDGAAVLLHVQAANPVVAAVRRDPRVTLAVTGDYAFAPGTWRASQVPTSYYAAVQLDCTAQVLEGPAEKAELLNRQLAHFQPETPEVRVVPGEAPFGKLLTGITGLRLTVDRARAKFKYDDHQPAERQLLAAERLAERGAPGDAGTREQLLRRLARRGGGCPAAD